jgi:DNA polymerase (family 10)
MINNEAANMFLELADLLDLAGELPFKSSSYRKVADSLRNLDTPFDQLVNAGQFDKIAGAGKAIKEKLKAIAETGSLPALDNWRKHEIAVFYPWLETLKLKPRPLGIIIRKLGAVDFKDLMTKLKDQDITKLTGRTKETADIILNNN